jgi:hypothetical protein
MINRDDTNLRTLNISSRRRSGVFEVAIVGVDRDWVGRAL